MQRITSVDVMRVIAIIAVIVIHICPFEESPVHVGESWDVGTVVVQMGRFAVPFFYILSGYLWAQKIGHESDVYPYTVKVARRIAFVFVAWSAIYLLPMDFASTFEGCRSGWFDQLMRNLKQITSSPTRVLFSGTKYHLWYLPSLLSALGITAFFVRYRQQNWLGILALALYIMALAGKAYDSTPLGFHSSFNLRNGPFFSLAFFVTGYFLQKYEAKPSWRRLGILISMAGITLQFSELYFLHKKWGISISQDFVVGTYFYGLGIAMIALSGLPFANLKKVAAVGPLVLGIYTSHLIFVELFRPIGKHFYSSSLWSVTFIVAVFGVSYLLVRILSRFAVTKPLVT
jgi:surface polysaccharide O-acyltransferase-like enzyme